MAIRYDTFRAKAMPAQRKTGFVGFEPFGQRAEFGCAVEALERLQLADVQMVVEGARHVLGRAGKRSYLDQRPVSKRLQVAVEGGE